MITVRRSEERGRFDYGWLDTRHTFSFGRYYDPEHMGFRSLRVINEDVVRGGRGFAQHPHENMEIITYIVSGELAHKDSTGTSSTIRRGRVQRMSAGTGIEHSEYNASAKDPVHLLQIWIEPEREGLPPGYEEKELGDMRGLRLIASPNGEKGSLTVHQNVRLYGGVLEAGKAATLPLEGKFGWVQAIKGNVTVNGTALAAGDGAAVSDEKHMVIDGTGEVLVFDLG